MKKVLIIAYAFPPHQVIGSERPFRIAKYLPQYGWEPVVLTVDRPGQYPGGIRVIKAKHNDFFESLKSKISLFLNHRRQNNLQVSSITTSGGSKEEIKLIKFMNEIIYFPDPARGWYKTAFSTVSRYLDIEKIDAIISTSSPETDHLIARRIKRKYGIPWIADFRDPWTQNAYRDKFSLINRLERKLELKIISDADAIVTVTEPWIDLLSSLHKGKRMFCISNGYDDEDFILKPTNLTSKFTITYAGSLYQGKRDPSLLFEVINELIKEKKLERDLIEIRFYGTKEERIAQQVKNSGMDDIVHFYGIIPRGEVIFKLQESQVLLLLLWNNKKESGFCPGKVYEYFGARRPILAIGWSGSVVRDYLKKTGAGMFADSPNTLRTILLEYYQEFIKYGRIKYANSKIERYNYALLAEEYSEVLNSMILI